MSGGASYSLSDFLLFSPATYFRLFELHNAAWWPAQLAALGAGAALVALSMRSSPGAGRIAALILAAAWLWVAWSFHHERYAAINWAAKYYAWAFAAQGVLLAWAAARGNLRLGAPWSTRTRIGLGLLILALAGWPLIAPVAGRGWAGAEVFAFAPDPTVLATLGVLAAAAKIRRELLPVPLLWCLVSGASLWTMASHGA